MLPTATDLEPRRELLATAQALNASGLNQGTSGNASLRIEGGLLVTPTSLPYAQMGPHDLVALD
ncbi:MAG: class II aldolase, partial [Cyanobacteria bacterium M_surface_9_m1_291]|nr:class II aldolase [Cyanobacteria bacterium M_surface_9_m1_291]